MKAAIIQHEETTPPGSTIDWLQRNEIVFSIAQLHLGENLPKLSEFDVLIVCGGSMNVDEEDKYAWMREEKKLIQEAITANKWVVGLCLGSQLIAEVLGAQVKRHPQPEVGWHKVKFTPDSLQEFGEGIMAFQFHSYNFEIPQGAQRIASSLACENQAYVYRQNVIAFQFHPEATVSWVKQCAESKNIPDGSFCQTRQEILAGLSYQDALQDWYFKILSQRFSLWQKGDS